MSVFTELECVHSLVYFQDSSQHDRNKRATKRPKSADLSNRTLADDKDEVVIKRPKLMEAQSTVSHDPAARKVEVRYFHLCACIIEATCMGSVNKKLPSSIF